MSRPRKLNPEIVEKSWNEVQQNKATFQGLFGNANFLLVDNSKTLGEEQARKKFSLNKGVYTNIQEERIKERENDDSSEEATETTETNRQEESKTTEQGGDERKESKTETSE